MMAWSRLRAPTTALRGCCRSPARRRRSSRCRSCARRRVSASSLRATPEHAHCWRREGHAVETRSAEDLIADADRYDVVVLIHPNNPGGECFEAAALLQVHARLASRGGWLIVDEAFIDATPAQSLCAYSEREGLIVLRSAGKFFGLAGARAGFVCAARTLLDPLASSSAPGASADLRAMCCNTHCSIADGTRLRARV